MDASQPLPARRFFSFPAQVNERAARLVGAGVAVSLGAALALRATSIVPVMALGFFLRVAWGPKLSPLARAAMYVAPRIASVRPVPGPPKRFAQGIGLACTVAASVLFALGWATAGWAMVGLVLVFATLEATLGFCMGCVVFARLQRAGVFPPDACVDCAAPSSR